MVISTVTASQMPISALVTMATRELTRVPLPMFRNTDGSSRAPSKFAIERATDSKVVSVTLDAGAQFGHSVAMLGVDPTNKAAVVLAVGAPMQEGGRGAVHMLSLQLASRGSAGRRLQTTPAATVAMRWLLNLPTAPAGERLGTSVAFILIGIRTSSRSCHQRPIGWNRYGRW